MLVSNISKSELLSQKADLLIICARSDKGKDVPQAIYPSEFASVEKNFNLTLGQHASKRQFRGVLGEDFVVPLFDNQSFGAVALLGTSDDSDRADLHMKIGAACHQLAMRCKAIKVVVLLNEHDKGHDDFSTQLIFEGALLASYSFDKYKSAAAEFSVQEITFASQLSPAASSSIVEAAAIRADAVKTVRDLINEPACAINPLTFASTATDIGKLHGFGVDVYDEKFLEKERMNLLLAVGAAMGELMPPRLIKLSYGSSENAPHICLIGKGITFDSGGLDIKPAAGMLTMKYDMSGAACVLGAMMAIAQLKPNIRLTVYLSCAENGVSSRAYHPGDVITSRSGVTVEVNNTDAEGRLVLADAISYAQDVDKPEIIIDVATLTGAAKIALGPYNAAIFSNHDALCQQLIVSGEHNAESLWRLPLDKRLLPQLKSTIADVKNTGGPFGGAITAGLFLQKFIREPVKWAHLDIAGPAFADKGAHYNGEGATGFGVRSLVAFLMNYSQNKEPVS